MNLNNFRTLVGTFVVLSVLSVSYSKLLMIFVLTEIKDILTKNNIRELLHPAGTLDSLMDSDKCDKNKVSDMGSLRPQC